MTRGIRVCNVAGCPELTDQPKCPTHRRDYQRSQGSTTARGYGTAHQKLRKRWVPKVAAGTVSCWRCGQRLNPLEDWDLGHDDLDRSITRGPECIPCNRGHGKGVRRGAPTPSEAMPGTDGEASPMFAGFKHFDPTATDTGHR